MGILNQFEQVLYDEVVGRKETHLNELTIFNLWKFFIECAEGNPRVCNCAVRIERKGDHYDITQIMLTKKMEPIRKDSSSYLGRSIQAYNIDESVEDFMGNAVQRNMQLESLMK